MWPDEFLNQTTQLKFVRNLTKFSIYPEFIEALRRIQWIFRKFKFTIEQKLFPANDNGPQNIEIKIFLICNSNSTIIYWKYKANN